MFSIKSQRPIELWNDLFTECNNIERYLFVLFYVSVTLMTEATFYIPEMKMAYSFQNRNQASCIIRICALYFFYFLIVFGVSFVLKGTDVNLLSFKLHFILKSHLNQNHRFFFIIFFIHLFLLFLWFSLWWNSKSKESTEKKRLKCLFWGSFFSISILPQTIEFWLFFFFHSRFWINNKKSRNK